MTRSGNTHHPSRSFRRMLVPRVVACLLVAGVAGRPVAAQSREWHVAFGVTAPVVSAMAADYPVSGTSGTLTTSPLTFPHVALGRQFGPIDVEAGYRKLGVLRYAGTSPAVQGNTHSNALEFLARGALVRRPGMALRAFAGAEVVRTIAVLTTRPASWPATGGVNTWRTLPVAGIDVLWNLNPAWAVDVAYRPVLGRLGTAPESGRYRQQVVGIGLVHRW
jgi:hypothetical protein